MVGGLLLVHACSSADTDVRQQPSAPAAQVASGNKGASTPSDGIAARSLSSDITDGDSANSEATAVREKKNEVVRDGARLVRSEALSPLWTRGGSRDDLLIALPMSLAADSERVVVYDSMDGILTAYSAATGDVQWRVGHPGRGPGEYGAYVVLARTPGGDFLAIDWQNLRLTYIEPSTGTTRRTMRWPITSSPQYACVTADDRLLTLSRSSGPPLVWVTDSVATLEAPLPWPNVRDANHLVTQSALAAGPRGDCVLALKYGQGFARYRQQDSLPIYARDYVEPVALATLTREPAPGGGTYISFAKGTTRAANAAAVSETEILVAFGGRSKFRHLLVDRYVLDNGDYVSSFLLPFKPAGIAVSAGRIFVIDSSDEYPAVRAFAVP